MYILTPTQAPCECFLLTLGDLQAVIFRVRHQTKNSLISTVLVERLFFLQWNQAAYFIIDEAVYIRNFFFHVKVRELRFVENLFHLQLPWAIGEALDEAIGPK